MLGENGLITQAKEAREQTKTAEVNEKTQMGSASDFISEAVNNTELPQTNETKPYMPEDGFTKVEDTNLANGLTIQDSDGNQYVWAEVPKTVTVYPTAGLHITEFNTETYTKIEDDLHQYTMSYRKVNKDTETGNKDEYAEDTTDGWFKNAEEYNQQKYKMLKGIYQNGGFWVGRYEVGIDQIRATRTDITTITNINIKENKYPCGYLKRTEAKIIAEKFEYGKYKGSLMLGVQWDLILAFIHEKENVSNDVINKDCSTIGNCPASEIKINRGKFARHGNLERWYNYDENLDGIVINKIKKAQKAVESTIILTTGATDIGKTMNIYDICGNAWEWTLEKSIKEEYPCVYRGGVSEYNTPASYRSYHSTSPSGYDIGFRIVLY